MIKIYFQSVQDKMSLKNGKYTKPRKGLISLKYKNEDSWQN